jgi:hypothetical protein
VALTVTDDLAPADWIANSTLDWSRLVEFGPSGFLAYARLRYLPDPSCPGQSESDAPDEGDEMDAWRMRQWAVLMRLLATCTSTPQDCYVCVWEGYSDDGTTRFSYGTQRKLTDEPHSMPLQYRDDPTWHWAPAPMSLRKRPRTPMVVVPHRSYYLFRGTVEDAARWRADGRSEELRVEHVLLQPPELAFVWPADRAWCVAFDVDPHWAGIGASRDVIEALVADENLDAVRADPDAEQPRYR